MSSTNSRQIVGRNNYDSLMASEQTSNTSQHSLRWWAEQYIQHEVTTAESSRKVQIRDLALFLSFLENEAGSDNYSLWTPRMSKLFIDQLRSTHTEQGERHWSDITINRIIAHLKTWAKWLHSHKPFVLGNPTAKITNLVTASSLLIDKALTPIERNRILDAADLLVEIGGRKKDRRKERKANNQERRSTYREYRNRAMIYLLIETGMRRQAVVELDLSGVDSSAKTIITREKGGSQHRYKISSDGMAALQDYIDKERATDSMYSRSQALFLPAFNVRRSGDRLSAKMVNSIWNEACTLAGVEGKTPHSARHAMGKHIMQKTGNVAAVQRQLGHKNAAYSLQYARITGEELLEVLDDR